MMPELIRQPAEERCPDHGDTLRYHQDQESEWGEWEWREHLECSVTGCEYEVWA